MKLTSIHQPTRREGARWRGPNDHPAFLEHVLTSLAFACCSLVTPDVAAHPISLSGAVVDVRADRITAEIEIMLEDLVLYHQLQAGEDYTFSADGLMGAAEKHREFLLKYFSIRDADGNRLLGRVGSVDKSQIDPGGVAQSDLMSRTVKYGVTFNVNKPQAHITLMQTFGGPKAILPAVMDLMLLHNGILTQRPVQLSHSRPHSVSLDWDNPPTRAPQGMAGLRRERAAQFRQRLGITSYGELYSYIYITPQEVRHEILIPLLTFERWSPIDRASGDFLEVSEQLSAEEQIADFFCKRCPVEINGELITPELTRLSFFGLDISDFASNAEPRRVSVYQARLGVILTYRTAAAAENMQMRWGLFNEYAPSMRSILLVDDDDPREHFFRRETPVLGWTRTGAVKPDVEAVKGTTARVNDQKMTDVITHLLQNIYTAFEFREDSDIYDALATSVTEDLLPQLYLQIKRSLLMAEQGGAQSRVHRVDVVTLQREGGVSESQAQYRCTWQVEGTVQHWGHIHTRTSEYSALLSIQCKEGVYRFDKVEIESLRRVRSETKVRGFP